MIGVMLMEEPKRIKKDCEQLGIDGEQLVIDILLKVNEEYRDNLSYIRKCIKNKLINESRKKHKLNTVSLDTERDENGIPYIEKVTDPGFTLWEQKFVLEFDSYGLFIKGGEEEELFKLAKRGVTQNQAASIMNTSRRKIRTLIDRIRGRGMKEGYSQEIK